MNCRTYHAPKQAGRLPCGFLVAVFAGIPSARRAAAVQPIVAMRAE